MSDKSFSNEPIQGNKFLWLLKSTLLGWLVIISKLLFPAIFIISGALIYSEIESAIQENVSSASEMLAKFGDDIMSNPALFIAFLIILGVWVFTQLLKKDELKEINKKLDTLISEIRQDRDERKRKENYDG